MDGEQYSIFKTMCAELNAQEERHAKRLKVATWNTRVGCYRHECVICSDDRQVCLECCNKCGAGYCIDHKKEMLKAQRFHPEDDLLARVPSRHDEQPLCAICRDPLEFLRVRDVPSALYMEKKCPHAGCEHVCARWIYGNETDGEMKPEITRRQIDHDMEVHQETCLHVPFTVCPSVTRDNFRQHVLECTTNSNCRRIREMMLVAQSATAKQESFDAAMYAMESDLQREVGVRERLERKITRIELANDALKDENQALRTARTNGWSAARPRTAPAATSIARGSPLNPLPPLPRPGSIQALALERMNQRSRPRRSVSVERTQASQV